MYHSITVNHTQHTATRLEKVMSAQSFETLYSEEGFFSKVKQYAQKMGTELLEKALWLYYLLQEPTVPASAKAIVYGALGYLISPLDLIPDTTPVVGYTDDLVVLSMAVAQLAMYITPEIKQKAKERQAIWFN